MTGKRQTIDVFFAYAREDETLRDELETYVSPLKRLGLISGWHDRKIGAGVDWEQEIDKHLNGAAVILLLISADFIASDYIWSVEMTRALERHTTGEARVIPIILRACNWTKMPFGKLQVLPTDGKPVKSWANHDEAFTNVAIGIERVIEEMIDSSPPDLPVDTPIGDTWNPFRGLPRRPRRRAAEIALYMMDHDTLILTELARNLRVTRPVIKVNLEELSKFFGITGGYKVLRAHLKNHPDAVAYLKRVVAGTSES